MVGRGAVDQLQQVHGLPSLPGKPVPAGHAVAEVRQVGTLQTLVRHFLCHFPVGVLGQAAVAAAGRPILFVGCFFDPAAQALRNPADALLGLSVAPCAAGIVDGNGLVQPFCLFRQADVIQNFPDTANFQVFMGRKLLFTGGAPGDDGGIAQLRQLFAQKFHSIVVHLIPACPVADGAAAAQHQGNTVLQTPAQIQIRRPDGGRGDGRGLTAGEKHIATPVVPRLGTAQKRLAVGKEHVHQGKFMGCQWHFPRGDHVLPGNMADLRHIVAVGAEHAALTAQGARVDGLVHHVVAHDNGDVVIDFPGENPGKFPVMLQIGTALDAFLTPALNAAAGLRHGAFPIGAGNPLRR